MEYEVFLSKTTFLKSVIKEVQDLESSLWVMLEDNHLEQLPDRISYMQELIIQMLRILKDIEVEILLFRVEKSELGQKVEKELEDLYVLFEVQKRDLCDISTLSKDRIVEVLNGDKANVEGFSETSSRIKKLLKQIESDGNSFEKEQ